MKKPVRKSRQSSRSTEAQRSHAHAEVIARLRGAVLDALNPQALCDLLWDEATANKVDIDRVVDDFARTHSADGYRDPKLQKAALDAIQETLAASLPDAYSKDFRTLTDGQYSRFILSFDVGFLAGYAAAKGGRQ